MKVDLKKERRDLYQPGTDDFSDVDVPVLRYLSMSGHGDPNTDGAYAMAVQTLCAGAYAIKYALRARSGDDFVVGPLEGLWTSDDPTAFTNRRKAEWDWTMLISLPDVVTDEDIGAGLTSAVQKKPDLRVPDLRPVEIEEGRCLQIMHVGSYDAEAVVLARLHEEIMPARGLTWNGPHHELYLSDPRRVAPERLRTVLRQPVRPTVG